MLHLKIIVIIVVILLWNIFWNTSNLPECSVEVDKEKYYHNTVNKLMNIQKNSKLYWFLLKIFLNNKKIPIIPPLFYENRFITDFKEKDNFLIFYFLNNAPSFLIIALFLLMLTILLTNVYLQFIFRQRYWKNHSKSLFKQSTWTW